VIGSIVLLVGAIVFSQLHPDRLEAPESNAPIFDMRELNSMQPPVN
jgi:hypothetical protein